MALQAPQHSGLQAFIASPLQARASHWKSTIDTPETELRSLEEFGAYLYIGTATNGRVYRTIDGETNGGYSSTGNTYVWALLEYGSYLLAGLGETLGQIKRSSDGTTWNTSFSDANYIRITSFAVFGGHCYAAGAGRPETICKIVRSADGVTWAEVYSQAGYYTGMVVAVLGAKIYCGCGASGRILTSSNGTTWTTAITLPGVGQVRALCVFGSYLYAGCEGGTYGEVWRSSDGSSWSKVATLTALTKVVDLYVFDAQIFALGTGDFSVYRSPDGETWLRDFNGSESYGLALHDFGGQLYAGTATSGKLYRRY